ncbi:hypothetical protein [Brevibacillus dissolubilis]|uniref:hypothetical protein n=1 Tax=Brevibacillus dissolubilis TaxID=1844116 RepID=UPI001116BB2F|nr:hypothetical protein [Brevibacillus dissolubilis]
MSHYLSFLLSVLVLMIPSIGSTTVYVYQNQQATIHTVYQQLSEEVAKAGYLDPAVKQFYIDALRAKGFPSVSIHASTESKAFRIVRPRYGQEPQAANLITLEMTVEPTSVTRLFSLEPIHWERQLISEYGKEE